MIFSQIYLRLTLDRRIRAALPADKKYDFIADWYFGFFRVNCFGLATCFDWANKSWVIRDHYEGFDVKGFANRFEKLLGYILIVTAVIVVSSGLIAPILSFFGYL